MHHNDIITETLLTEYLEEIHKADPTRDADSIARWRRKTMRDRDVVRKKKATNIYVPYLVNRNHWMLFEISTVHDCITVYNSMEQEAYTQAAKHMVALIQKWWKTHDDQPLLAIKWGSCVQQPRRNAYDCGLCVCLNLRRLMLKRRRPRPLTRTRSTTTEWGYTNDQEELNDWRWHITKELARGRIMSKAD